MTIVSIVYDSKRGHTKKLAEAVLKGVMSVENVDGHIFSADEAMSEFDILNKSDAIIFGSPTFMGTISAKMKEFMDSTSKVWYKQAWKDKLAAGFVNSGWPSGDKLNTMNQLSIFAAQHGMIWVSLGMLPGDLQREACELNRLGSFLGAMSCSPAKESCEVAPPECDLQTAEFLGKRVSDLAKKFIH